MFCKQFIIRFSLSLNYIFNRRVAVNIYRTPQQVNPDNRYIYCKTTPIHRSHDLWPSEVCGVFFTMVLKSCQDRGKPTRGYEDHVSLACGWGSRLTRVYLKLDLMSLI